MTPWDRYFLEMARHVATRSTDRSTKVGCVIVGPDGEIRATGHNGFPRGVDDTEDRHQRPAKYAWTEHAERNAIYSAARAGIATKGCGLVMTWFPCADCARAVIQAGITGIVCATPDPADSRWGEDFRVARAMLREAGVTMRFAADAAA